ncbi:2-phospho-L-lactate guanylyltransferase [Novosphingobium sp. MMS21-SN21R]|uniref:2-phospho-L-lactate guanylyltransferase n=1 Tax=Novosphingobium sp. MMS21-SN21R TaxID=2969298 RepID=UPI00288894C3|nr:2-phospho-L-lactate guanylyltransferase [Novosphingobium sp. MMS21-SN21R]MDT0509570.1 2-phospho-L-lactate guanylyltransferase [Novosphingobium sp. MMS21-SN21R]
MNWTAIVPLKAAADRKTRLAGALDGTEKAALAEGMADHVIATLADVPAIASIRVLSPESGDIPGTIWEPDHGKGLNAELDRVCAALAGERMVIVHADLPLLTADDINALLGAAEGAGAAIATDRHGMGTNALAMREATGVGFTFGPDSLVRHLERLPHAAVLRRDGLAIDIDTADDIAAARGALPLGRW